MEVTGVEPVTFFPITIGTAYVLDNPKKNRFKSKKSPDNVRTDVEVTGVEPVTFCMPCKRSSQLS